MKRWNTQPGEYVFVCEGAGREGNTLTCRNGKKCCLNDGWERACGLIMLLKDLGLFF